jgi:hypothetical protein
MQQPSRKVELASFLGDGQFDFEQVLFEKELQLDWKGSGRPTQRLVLAVEGLGGVGVRNFTSSFESTACGLKGTKPAPRNPA